MSCTAGKRRAGKNREQNIKRRRRHGLTAKLINPLSSAGSMNQTETCSKCGGRLVKTGSMNSGNSTFITYQCTSCGQSVTKCVGLNPPETHY
ncbi:hypothetical protein D6764_01550 [Candidatus Woesearchaeota archaeon]|nr:MAG: hypothetical protein D6764_01550 [Candidatus Woesearchaeota archaeon]